MGGETKGKSIQVHRHHTGPHSAYPDVRTQGVLPGHQRGQVQGRQPSKAICEEACTLKPQSTPLASAHAHTKGHSTHLRMLVGGLQALHLVHVGPEVHQHLLALLHRGIARCRSQWLLRVIQGCSAVVQQGEARTWGKLCMRHVGGRAKVSWGIVASHPHAVGAC